jgi:hypothetical protein
MSSTGVRTAETEGRNFGLREYRLMMFAVAVPAPVGITAVAGNRWVMRAIVNDTIPVELMNIGIE